MAKDSETNLLISKGVQTQNIFIPVLAFEQLITDLPLSAELIRTLKFFKFSKLGELHSIPYRKILKKFINVNLRSYNLIAELYTFLTSLQSTETSGLTGNENDFEKEERFFEIQPKKEKTEIYNQEKAESPEIKHSPTAETVNNLNDDFESFLEETIFIAPTVKEYPVSLLELSVRLENVLRILDVKMLGDLHEMSFRQIFHSKNCGRKSIFELRDLIEKIHQDEVFVVKFDGDYDLSNLSKTSEGKISVPESVKEMLIKYFSFSNRLKNVLNNLAVSTLGDLEIYSLDEIRQTGRCGQKTINELRELLEKFQDENFLEKLKDDYRRHLENADITNARQELIKRIEGTLEKRLDTIIKNKEGKIFIPQSVKEITVKSFVFSGTVEKIFDYLDINALADLPENARNAAILHYLDGWQIESKDERQPTISKLFNVSSRTIRNWLNEAREILAAQ